MKFVTVMSYYFDSTFRKFFLILIFMCGVLAYFVGKGSISPYSVFINKKLTIRSTGSTSMSRVLNLLSEEFMKIYPDFVYEKSETGSGAALISVKSRYTDIGDMSCEPKEFENLKKIYVALDGIAVIVNNNNMVSNLSLDSLRNIFKKKIKNWSEIVPKFDVPITVIGREEASGTREGFEKISGDSQYDIILPESGDISAKVSNEDGAIGYISLPSVSNKVQKVNINDVECNPKNIKNGEYAISRPFIQIYEENLENEILNKWLEFLKSEDAKKIIESERLISIS